MKAARWEHFHHQADIGVRGFGDDVASAFEQSALALTAVITDPDKIQALERIDLVCDAPDLPMLLTDWLNALIFEMATRKMLFSRFEVRIDGEHLIGAAWGEKIDRRRHEPAVEVKGATYTELHVGQEPDGSWRAQCVVDV